MSVIPRHNGPKFTDKSSKIDALSVNLDEIFAELVEQRCLFKKMLCSSFLTQSSD
ncbi:hypothetical protein FC25_GL002035 [Ligilactobacillus ruminis DSM 20403 = NBRC 102161]|nr:hypothetical protein FC25_GL002035 [Ligilactobacillus ruminis DSM 20403 = NBRC 102161]